MEDSLSILYSIHFKGIDQNMKTVVFLVFFWFFYQFRNINILHVKISTNYNEISFVYRFICQSEIYFCCPK